MKSRKFGKSRKFRKSRKFGKKFLSNNRHLKYRKSRNRRLTKKGGVPKVTTLQDLPDDLITIISNLEHENKVDPLNVQQRFGMTTPLRRNFNNAQGIILAWIRGTKNLRILIFPSASILDAPIVDDDVVIGKDVRGNDVKGKTKKISNLKDHYDYRIGEDIEDIFSTPYYIINYTTDPTDNSIKKFIIDTTIEYADVNHYNVEILKSNQDGLFIFKLSENQVLIDALHGPRNLQKIKEEFLRKSLS